MVLRIVIPQIVPKESLPAGPGSIGKAGGEIPPLPAVDADGDGEAAGLTNALTPAPDDADDRPPVVPAVADDNAMESAVVQLASRRRSGEARGFLDATAKPPPTPPPPAPVAEATPSADDDEPQETPAAAAAPPQPKGFVGPIVKDLARGVVEAPLQVLGGMRDAIQSSIDLASWLHDNSPISKLVGAPDVTGNIPNLPKVKDATTVTGGVVHGVAQFLTGFVTAGKLLAGVKLGATAGAMAKGAFSDFAAFDGQDQKLSDLIQQYPKLQNPVTDFLSTKPDDGEAIGRFKRAVEGAGLGVVAEGFVRAVKFLRDAHRAHQNATVHGLHPETAPPAAKTAAAKPANLLGDEEAPLTIKPNDLGVPDDVAAKGVAGAARDQREVAGMGDETGADLKGMTPLGNGEIAINFARINTADDVKRVLQDAADAFKGEIDDARRGVRSHEQTAAAAYETDAWNALASRRAGAPLNAEQTVAARNLWEASGRKLMEIADAAAASPSPENLYQFRKMLAIHQTIQREVLAARAETGRALDAWKIESRGGSNRLNAIKNLLDTYGGPEVSELLANKVASLKNLPEGLGVAGDMAERTALAKSFGVVKEWYTNALLSNPVTHVKVVMSNALMQALDIVERAAAAGWSHAFGSGQVQAGEAAAAFFARTSTTSEAWKLAAKAFVMGQSQFGRQVMQYADMGWRQEIAAANFKLQNGAWRDPSNWLGNGVDALGAVINVPGRMVGSQDDFFRMMGYRGEVAARAFRRVAAEVANGTVTKADAPARVAEIMRNPPEDIHLGAADHARYLNFTSPPGKFVKAINDVERKLSEGHLGGQIGALMLRYLLPFRNTPAQIGMAAFERTPLAPLLSRFREAVAAGGAQRDIALSKMALGTMGFMSVLDLALDGHISGGGPRGEANRGTRQTMQRAGWQPYSVKLGDRYFAVNQLDPFGMHMGLAADIAEIINNSARMDADHVADIGHVVASSVMSYAENVLDKTYMTGPAELQRALEEPDQAAKYFDKQLAALAGAGAGWARRQLDPSVRYSHDLVTTLKNKIPGLSDDLPQARDFWGRARSYQSGMGAIYDATMPMQSRVYKPEPIDKEALDNGFNLTMPAPTLSFGKGMSLYMRDRPELYSRFLEIRGQMKPSEMPGPEIRDASVVEGLKVKDTNPRELLIKKYGDTSLLDLLNDVVSGKNPDLSDAYQQASAGQGGGRESIVKHIVSDYTRAAKGALIHETGELQEKLNVARPAKKKPATAAAPAI